jgi:hypothetical protein
MPLTERIRASRMRDIRTSGLKRGEEAVSLSLPYSTATTSEAVALRVFRGTPGADATGLALTGERPTVCD